MFSKLLYCEIGSKMPKITLALLTADTQMLSVVCALQSLESDQSDTAICASVKVNDYYTVDSSSWICVRLTTVRSNSDSLNQNKHLGSIIPCWKPLIVNSLSTLSRMGLNTELWTNALFLNSHTVHLRNTLSLIYFFGVIQVHTISEDCSEFEMVLEQMLNACLLIKRNNTINSIATNKTFIQPFI